MRFRKAVKTDAERLAETIIVFEKLRHSYDRDPWSFIGAVMTEYHGLRKAAQVAGQLQEMLDFEKQIAASVEFNGSKISEPPKEEPYR